MAHLHQAVDLGAALDARLAHRGAVHRGQALDLHIVFNHGHARLYDFEVRAVGALGEAVTVPSHHYAILQDHAVADPAELPYRRTRVSQKIVADFGAFIDHHVRMQYRVAPQLHAFPDHRERPDRAILPDHRARDRKSTRLNSSHLGIS